MEQNPTAYDVVIIGAGPSGLACALTLAPSNLSVLVLDQKEKVGPKVCAGGLTRKDLNHLNLPEALLDFHFQAMTIHTPLLSTEATDEYDLICTIDRERFAAWQLAQLSGSPRVEVRQGCQVTAITPESVTLQDGSVIRYRHLVGADGSFSAVRRYLGLKTEDTAVAIQYIIPTDRYRKLEFFLDSKLFHTWYAWIFPHQDYVSIGCMCDPRYLSAKKLQQNFQLWLQEKNIDIGAGKFQGYAINYDYRGYKFGNVFLAGDAAGLASGLTGEGIYQAVVSGEEVGKTILDENHASTAIADLLETKRLQNKAMHAVIKMGPLRDLFFASLVPAIKNRKMALWIVKHLS